MSCTFRKGRYLIVNAPSRARFFGDMAGRDPITFTVMRSGSDTTQEVVVVIDWIRHLDGWGVTFEFQGKLRDGRCGIRGIYDASTDAFGHVSFGPLRPLPQSHARRSIRPTSQRRTTRPPPTLRSSR